MSTGLPPRTIEIIPDFGPFDLGLTYKVCQQLHEAITTASEHHKKVVYFATNNPQTRSNCATLVCAYLVFVLNYTVEQAYGPFIGIDPPFITYRDAGFCINTFPITVLDNCKAMRKARTLGHFNFRTFSLNQFQHLSKLQHGDISWIIPGKFIAFSGPLTKRRTIGPGLYTLTPEQYVPLFKNLGVTCVVRFNDKCYDRKVFLSNGIRHVDLFYEDGGNPTEAIVQAFLQICENERGAIAVHCKAGLGRTGTNIAAYMMKHYGYTAKESIAWCRICRPGSIVGPQQQYLVSIEDQMWHEGQLYREKHRILPLTTSNGSGGGSLSGNNSVASGSRLITTSSAASNHSNNNGLASSSVSNTNQIMAIINNAAQAQAKRLALSNNNNNNASASTLPRPSTSGGLNNHRLLKQANDNTSSSQGYSSPNNSTSHGSNEKARKYSASGTSAGGSASNVLFIDSSNDRPRTSHQATSSGATRSSSPLGVQGGRPGTNTANRNSSLRQSMESQTSQATNSTLGSLHQSYFGGDQQQQQTLARNNSKQAWGRDEEGRSPSSGRGGGNSSNAMPPLHPSNDRRPKTTAGTNSLSKSLDSASKLRAAQHRYN